MNVFVTGRASPEPVRDRQLGRIVRARARTWLGAPVCGEQTKGGMAHRHRRPLSKTDQVPDQPTSAVVMLAIRALHVFPSCGSVAAMEACGGWVARTLR